MIWSWHLQYDTLCKKLSSTETVDNRIAGLTFYIFFHLFQPQSWSRIVCLVFLLVSVVVSLGLVAWVFARSTIQQSCLVFLVGEFSRISLFLVFLVFLVAERRRSGTRSSERGLTRSGTENLTLHTEWSSFKVVIIVSGRHTEWMPTATRTDEFPNGVPNDLWLLINASSKKLQYDFPKMRGGLGQRLFWTFPKIYPFWWT